MVKILGDRTLDEISNTRIFRLKQRTLPRSFDITHLPGKTNAAADATSRYPSPDSSMDTSDTDIMEIPPACNTLYVSESDWLESEMVASIRRAVSEFTTLSWDTIASATLKDSTLHQLMKAIEEGFDDTHRAVDANVSAFWQYRESLHVLDGVILYADRIVIPYSLRSDVLLILHSAHQCVSAMESCARAIVFWPGMTNDTQKTCVTCSSCNENAPSQPATPPIQSPIPSTPFEHIFAEFFSFGGHLLAGDRLSGWVEIFQAPHSTSLVGATGLINALCNLFATFGVPEELSSDGGPDFAATATSTFLNKWGVHQRQSSAHFPQSNGRAEVAVKKCKHLLMDNVGPTGTLHNDNFLRALLQVRNTPNPDCNVSPAEIIFGRPIWDAFSFENRLTKFENPSIRQTWCEAWQRKDDAMRVRFSRSSVSPYSCPPTPISLYW